MSNFLDSLKHDLLDRRMRPVVAIVAVALLGAVAYTAFAGSSTPTRATAAAHIAPVALPGGITVTQHTSEDALAETTSGSSPQRGGKARDPFGEQSSPSTGAGASGSSASTSSSSSSSASSSSSGGSGSSSTTPSSTPSSSTPTPSTGKSPSKSGKPKTVYLVDALFGEIPAGSKASAAPGTYNDLALLTPLPSRKLPLLVFRGVKAGGKSATFSVAGEAILSGEGACEPSPYHCEAISLKSGQIEQVQYLPPGSQTVVAYELHIVTIVSGNASTATVARLWRAQSTAGLEVLRSANLLALPGLRQTSVAGVLASAR